MGKPIAGRDKSPFGVTGINVDAAVLQDGTKLTNVRISKQRSSSMFDLLSADGATVYKFVQLTGVDASGNNLVVGDTNTQLSNKLAPGTFCISAVDVDGDVVGFAIKLQLNKVNLQDGTVLYITDYNSQGQVIVSVTGVTVNPTTLALDVGASSTITETVAPADATNKSVSWSSGTTSVATVNSAGLVTAIANGTSTITVTTVDGSQTATCAVTVTTPVSSVSLDPTTATLSLAGTTTQQLTPTIAPATASNQAVTYASSDPAIATVDGSGLVTAVSVGSATITVTTTDGSKTATCAITVTA